MLNDYTADIAILILIYISLGASLNLLMGYAGQFSMAQAVFYGIGAYSAGLLAVNLGFSPVVSIIGAIVISFISAGILALPAAKRVSGEYLILLTLAFQIVVNQLMNSMRDLTGGPYGFTVPWLTILGRDFITPVEYVPLMVIGCLIVLLVTWGIGESPFGRLLKGIREDETAVRALGKNTALAKVLVFGITAGLAGFIGGLSAYYYQFIAPGTYSLDLSIFVVSIIVLGGIGNLTGTIVGAIILGGLRPFLQNVDFIGDENSYSWQAIIYGLALILLMMYRPEGLLPEGIGFGALWRRLTGRTLPSQIGMPKTPELIAANGKVATPMPVGTDVTVLSTGRSGGVPTGPVSADSDIVRVEDLAKHFGGIYAVNGVNLVLSENQITALIGPNGAGKTTIFNLITGVLTPDRGRVYLRGRDITGKPPNEVATLGMARSFQDTRLFRRLTVLQNVAMAVPHQTGENVASLALRPLRSRRVEEETLAKAMGYLELVEMADTAHALVANLGYGEQKVVAIARLLATESPVLLLDEPTSGIDPAILDDMIALVLRLKALGRTICVVEHSLHVVEKLADHVVFMEDGRVTAEGTIDELTSQQRLVEAYFGT
ncbi:MAG: transporter [Thermomicrobiales bacterium]|jgi:branched-chain amino acid transport system permease protein|nr:transporter [Thermomicrobiales bacterium]MDF3015217.1 transporter [Thermomicrobiales bacterium]